MKTKTIHNILLSLLIFLGVGAIFGGGVFILSPSGELFQMPLSFLDNSPFRSFLIPGIILFAVLGVAPLVVVYSLINKTKYKPAELFNFCKDMHWAWTYSLYIAFALIIWIQTEMIVLRVVHWSHTLYMFLSIAIIVTALSPQMRNQYKK